MRLGMEQRPCRKSVVSSNPTCYGSRGQGAKKQHRPPCRRRHSCEEPWDTTDVCFVEPALRTPPLALQSPRVGVGACDTLSALGHTRLPTVPDGQASGGQGGVSPLHPLTRVPLDPVVQHLVRERPTATVSGARRRFEIPGMCR